MIKTCEFCGQEFETKSNRQKYCTMKHFRNCPSCGKLYVEKFSENLSKPPRLCSPRCGSYKKTKLPEFSEIIRIQNHVIVDSCIQRNKYDNLVISKYFLNQGLHCIHKFPEDNVEILMNWCNRPQEFKSSEFSIYKLNLDYAEEFIQINDIVKFKKSTCLSVGLVKDYKIFQILCFSKPRYNTSFNYEISHICTKQGCRIVGGLDALTSSASLLLGVTDCICYVDLSKVFDYSELLSIGLKFHHRNVPRLRSSNVFDCGTDVLMF